MHQFDSLYEMMQIFGDEQACIDHLRAIRWKNDAFCPHCASARIYYFSDNRMHKCGNCKKRFSIKVGTIFEDSKLPLRKWFMAIFLLTSHKKGIASTALAKDLGVTQKTAWFMLHRLRHAAKTKSFNRPLGGIVECNETYIGGKENNKHKRKPGSQEGANKAVVWGAQERDGELRAEHVEDATGKTVKCKIEEHVADGSTVMTDEGKAYNGIQGRVTHLSVIHSAGQWVKHFIIHTNGLEYVWSHFKRQIVSVHHWISETHLQRYLDEFTWRWNAREMGQGESVNSLLNWVGGRLTYKELTA